METASTTSTRPGKLGSSIPVKSVQDLAANSNNLTAEVLERYIRPEIDGDTVSDGESGAIPIVDLGRLFDEQFMQDEAAKLKLACEEWGFFQVTNHGIPNKVIEGIKAATEEFFKLPPEEKQKVAQLPGDVQGYGQAFVVSEDQKLDWADMYFIVIQPVQNRNMRLWPTKPSIFRDSLESYSVELKKVADCLLRSMAVNLGIDPEKFSSKFESQTMRFNYYPPCRYADKVLGLSPHSDGAGLTLLLQASQVEGLQIKRDGSWLAIKPLPDALIVNIGDLLEVLSNGKYKSIEHRAVIHGEKERMSIAAFHSTSFTGTTVGPLPELVEGSEEFYKTVSMEEYIKLFISRKLDGKSLVEQMKLKK
ncbi:S-norcoclaurine synthase 1-like [Typha angustifolia]|uniref:S-norcoclaurine synthase 1-like n=1 Tax=Typha angustifolia TaxID=59011 RepID=UPI003C30A0A1